jgi:hypothetical protein
MSGEQTSSKNMRSANVYEGMKVWYCMLGTVCLYRQEKGLKLACLLQANSLVLYFLSCFLSCMLDAWLMSYALTQYH